MAGVPPRVQTAMRQLPLAAAWLVAAWPVLLWLVYRSDPEAAVGIVMATQHLAWEATWWLGGIAAVGLVTFPPALAWLRRAANRLWLAAASDPAPLQQARAELRNFETAARHAEIGRLLRLRRQNQQALPHLLRAVQLDDGIASAWHQLGLVAFALHEWRNAADAFTRAERLDPGHAFGDALLHHGRALHELGERGALGALEEHRRRHGGGPRSLLWLADARLRAGDRAGAVAALREAAAPPRQRLTAEDNWFRALARVRLWGKGGAA